MAEKPKLLGLTGNISSGKSTVRQYLENEGALTIDADLLAQDTYLPGHPAYQPILETFGSDICYADGQINRSKLGRIVFREPGALKTLEKIVHPHVIAALEDIMSRAQTKLVVVEAIKLFEADLHLRCDAVWAVVASDQVRKVRLMTTRGLSEVDALTRINAQNPQEEKASRADRIIHTDTSFEATYIQVMEGLDAFDPNLSYETLINSIGIYRPLRPLYFEKARGLLNHFNPQPWSNEEIFRTLSQRSVLFGFNSDELISLILWKIDYIFSLLQSIIPHQIQSEQITEAIQTVEASARQHLCEAFFIPQTLISAVMAKTLGYVSGEYYPAEIYSFAITNYLRKHGFMPGEIYLHCPIPIRNYS